LNFRNTLANRILVLLFMKRFWYFVPFLVVGLIVLLGLHAYLSPTEPLKKGVLVAEGWMDQGAFAHVAAAFKSGDYAQVVTTGTLRPFTYYLNNEQQLLLGDASNPQAAEFALSASGVPGARMAFITGGDTLFDTDLTENTKSYTFNSKKKVIKELAIKTYSTVSTDWSFRISIVNSLTVNGSNAHLYFNQAEHVDRLGVKTLGTRTYAETAIASLLHWDIPADKIVTVPALDCATPGRTKCNAAHFAKYMAKHTGQHADLITLGVHARRSHRSYQEALPADFELGIISIEDPACEASNWLLKSSGRQKVLKELGGLFFGSVIDPNTNE